MNHYHPSSTQNGGNDLSSVNTCSTNVSSSDGNPNGQLQLLIDLNGGYQHYNDQLNSLSSSGLDCGTTLVVEDGFMDNLSSGTGGGPSLQIPNSNHGASNDSYTIYQVQYDDLGQSHQLPPYDEIPNVDWSKNLDHHHLNFGGGNGNTSHQPIVVQQTASIHHAQQQQADNSQNLLWNQNHYQLSHHNMNMGNVMSNPNTSNTIMMNDVNNGLPSNSITIPAEIYNNGASNINMMDHSYNQNNAAMTIGGSQQSSVMVVKGGQLQGVPQSHTPTSIAIMTSIPVSVPHSIPAPTVTVPTTKKPTKRSQKTSGQNSGTGGNSKNDSGGRVSKPVSAYALFFRDTQASIKVDNPSASFGEISKIVASKWDLLKKEDKDVYKERADLEKRNYLQNLASSKAKQVASGMAAQQSQNIAVSSTMQSAIIVSNANSMNYLPSSVGEYVTKMPSNMMQTVQSTNIVSGSTSNQAVINHHQPQYSQQQHQQQTPNVDHSLSSMMSNQSSSMLLNSSNSNNDLMGDSTGEIASFDPMSSHSLNNELAYSDQSSYQHHQPSLHHQQQTHHSQSSLNPVMSQSSFSCADQFGANNAHHHQNAQQANSSSDHAHNVHQINDPLSVINDNAFFDSAANNLIDLGIDLNDFDDINLLNSSDILSPTSNVVFETALDTHDYLNELNNITGNTVVAHMETSTAPTNQMSEYSGVHASQSLDMGPSMTNHPDSTASHVTMNSLSHSQQAVDSSGMVISQSTQQYSSISTTSGNSENNLSDSNPTGSNSQFMSTNNGSSLLGEAINHHNACDTSTRGISLNQESDPNQNGSLDQGADHKFSSGHMPNCQVDSSSEHVLVSPTSTTEPAAQKSQCIRIGCDRLAVVSAQWDNEFCSEECCVQYCSDVFQKWTSKKSTSSPGAGEGISSNLALLSPSQSSVSSSTSTSAVPPSFQAANFIAS